MVFFQDKVAEKIFFYDAIKAVERSFISLKVNNLIKLGKHRKLRMNEFVETIFFSGEKLSSQNVARFSKNQVLNLYIYENI